MPLPFVCIQVWHFVLSEVVLIYKLFFCSFLAVLFVIFLFLSSFYRLALFLSLLFIFRFGLLEKKQHLFVLRCGLFLKFSIRLCVSFSSLMSKVSRTHARTTTATLYSGNRESEGSNKLMKKETRDIYFSKREREREACFLTLVKARQDTDLAVWKQARWMQRERHRERESVGSRRRDKS